MSRIIKLNPVLTHNIWGGERLVKDFGYSIKPDENGNVKADDIGECWGISAHPSGDDTICGGEYDGMRLSELYDKHPELFGNEDRHYDRFPLLIKIIDAKDDLSIQVHPNDEYAKVHENGSLGKTECWYVLDCPEDGKLVVGHNAKSREELTDMIHSGRWSELIRELPVHKGDFIQIDPGTVHAIKGGILLLETQQSSDITYRLYDYDRLQNGKPRPLHIEQSIDVINVPAPSAEDSVRAIKDDNAVNDLEEMYSCKYYTVFHMVVDGEAFIDQKYDFMNLTVIEGSGSIDGESVKKGDHLILLSGIGKVAVCGKMKLVTSIA